MFKREPKLYWYSLCFTHKVGDREHTGSIRLGLRKNRVSSQVIEYANENLGMHPHAVLMSVSYIGRMTEHEYNYE